jgi:hypothetical protein
MTTLILPDVHNHTAAAEEIIARWLPDRVVFLGDYFDSFGDSPAEAAETARWLKKSLHTPGRVHLWGNHDLSYAFPSNSMAICPGFTHEKYLAVRCELAAEDWARIQVAHFLRPNLLCSHAGLLPELLEHPILGVVPERVLASMAEAVANVAAGMPGLLTAQDGPLWLRWWNFPLHEQVAQIVGHTVGEFRVKQFSFQPGDSFNVCLDTFGKYAGWYENDRFSVRRTADGETEWEEN